MEHKPALVGYLKNYPKEVILNDGTGVSIRPLQPGDEDPLFRMFKRLSEDDLWFLNHDVSDPKLIEGWIRNFDVNRVISLVALLEGYIIANAALMTKAYGAKSHIGKIRISVDPSFRGKRLGTWMLLDLGNLAMAIGLKMLVMRLVPGRDTAIIHSARRLEFVEEAVIKNYVLDRAGNSHDLIMMIKRLPYSWTNHCGQNSEKKDGETD